MAPIRTPLLAALVLLAGCGGRGDIMSQRPQAPCPRVALLAEAVDLTRHRAGTRPDIATVEVDARMTGFQARCDYAPRDAGLDVTLVVAVAAERGPTGGRVADLPWLIAVTDGTEGEVLSRGTDTLRVAFDGDSRRAEARSEQMMVRIPGDARRAAERSILVGFQLTPEQLAANRRRGVRP